MHFPVLYNISVLFVYFIHRSLYLLISCMHAKSLQSCPALCDPWAIAHQAPLSMEFSKQEYWSGLLYPPQVDLSDPGDQTRVFCSSCIAGRFLTTKSQGKPP